MRFIYITGLAFLAGFLIYNCTGNKETATNEGPKPSDVSLVLNPQSIYNADSIKWAMNAADDQQRGESRKLFLQGLDFLANKNNPKESVDFFKQSICYYPDEKNYMHLFKAYIATGDMVNAEMTNKILTDLTELWGIEYYEIEFNRALIAASQKDTSGCMEALSSAAMEGFVFKERIADEKLFAFLHDYTPYQSFFITNFGNDEKLTRALFKSFVNFIPDVELPLGINNDSAGIYNYDKYIHYNYAAFIPGMEEGQFSRDVTNEYMYVGKFKLEGGYAVIYKAYMVIADTLNPVKTFLATYDTTGKLVENEMIGCFCSPSSSMGFTINKDLSINITNYKTNWEADPLEAGYAGNKITGVEEEKSTLIIVDKGGVLKREEVAKTTESVVKSGG